MALQLIYDDDKYLTIATTVAPITPTKLYLKKFSLEPLGFCHERIASSFDLIVAVKEPVIFQSLAKFDVRIKPLAVFRGNVLNHEQTGIMLWWQSAGHGIRIPTL